MSDETFDAVVIGGGPGGSSSASTIALDGHRVLLLERERFPRYHIGESLLPSTVLGACRFLGAGKALEEAGFVKKYGGTFRWGKNPEPWTFRFSEAYFMESGPEVFAYQVLRSKFDLILLDNARRQGVAVREEQTATGVIFEGHRVAGVRYEDKAGTKRTVRSRYVIDASGQSSLLANRIGKKKIDEFFRNIALFGYFAGGFRFPEPERRGNIFCAAFAAGWIWYIPLSEELTSVGVVIRREDAGRIQELGAEAALSRFIDECPQIREMLRNAERVTTGDLGKVRVIRDYSYTNERFWAPGAVLVGDAACFIDPVFSSGVHLATYAGILAGRSVNSCLRGEVEEPAAFEEFERRYRREFALFYEFLVSFYEMHRDESSYFWSARKVLGAPDGGGREAFVRLVSGLSQTFTHGQAEQALAGLAKTTATLESLTASSGPVVPSREQLAQVRPRVSERLSLMTLGARADGTGAADAASEQALFEGGLAVSEDGLCWRHVGS
jgi:FAD-dependent halogenase